MRFLANENVPLTSIQRLREAGHDVFAIIEHEPGSDDREILARAARESRTILTFDRDYGELVYRQGLAIPSGVAFFRLGAIQPSELAERLLRLLKIPGFSLEGKSTVIEHGQVRQRSLPLILSE